MTGDNYIKIAHKQVKMRKKNIKTFKKTTYRFARRRIFALDYFSP